MTKIISKKRTSFRKQIKEFFLIKEYLLFYKYNVNDEILEIFIPFLNKDIIFISYINYIFENNILFY